MSDTDADRLRDAEDDQRSKYLLHNHERIVSCFGCGYIVAVYDADEPAPDTTTHRCRLEEEDTTP